MTNVPTNIRAMWTDLYKLFDSNYLMKNTDENWNRFWNEAREVMSNYDSLPLVSDFVILVGDFIGEQMKRDGRALEAN